MESLSASFESLVVSLDALRLGSREITSSELLFSEHTADQFRRTYVTTRAPSTRFTTPEGSFGLLATNERKSGRSSLEKYFTGITPVPILKNFNVYKKTFDAGKVLHNYFVPVLTPEQLKFVYGRLEDVSCGIPMRIFNLVPIVMMSIGYEKILSDPCHRVIFGYFKWLNLAWNKAVEEKDHWQNGDNAPFVRPYITVSVMAPKLMVALLDLAFIVESYQDSVAFLSANGIDVPLMLRQITSCMTESPIEFALKWKGAFGFAYLHAMRLTTQGTYISIPEGDSVNSYAHVPAPSVPLDYQLFKAYAEEEFNEHIKETAAAGMTEVSKMIKFSVRMPLTSEGYRTSTFISGLRAFIGYIATNPNETPSFKEVYDHKTMSPIYEGVGLPESYAKDEVGDLVMPHTEALRDSVGTMFNEIMSPLATSKFKMPHYHEFLSSLPTMLTANSAGIGKVEIGVSVKGKKMSFSTTSKIIMFFISPSTFAPTREYYDSGKKMTLEEAKLMYPSYSDDFLGQMAIRNVVAKDSRPIALQDLGKYVVELFLFAQVYRKMMREKDDRFTGIPIDHVANEAMTGKECLKLNSAVFSIGEESGSHAADHLMGLRVTGNAVSRNSPFSVKYLIICTDYKQFDQTECYANARQPIYDGIKKAHDELFGEGASIGPFQNISVVLDILFPKEGVPFQIPFGDVILLTGVRSGEFATMIINNWVNASVNYAVLTTLRSMGLLDAFHLKIMGDDVVHISRIPGHGFKVSKLVASAINNKYNEWAESDIPEIAAPRILVDIVNRCGLETHATKGIVSFMIYEYLKVKIVAGRVCENGYTRPFCSEKAKQMDPTEFMSGQIAKLRLVVARGADPMLIHRYTVLLFLIRCSYRVRHRTQLLSESSVYYPPMCMFYAPTSMAGIGCAPFMFPFPADPALGFWMSQPVCASYKALILERGGSFVARSSMNEAKIIAGIVVGKNPGHSVTVDAKTRGYTMPKADLDSHFGKGIDFMKQAQNLKVAEMCETSYKEMPRGMRFPSDLLYTNAPRREAQNALATNSKLQALVSRNNDSISYDYFLRNKVTMMSRGEIWIGKFAYEFRESHIEMTDDNWQNGPLCGLHLTSRSFMVNMGWGIEDTNIRKAISKLVSTIRSDRYFPRDITEETLLGLVCSRQVLDDITLLPKILRCLGTTDETVGEVTALFSDSAVLSAFITYMAGGFNINSPMFEYTGKSKNSLGRFVKDVSSNTSSGAAFPAMVMVWMFTCWSSGKFLEMAYKTNESVEAEYETVDVPAIVPVGPTLESEIYAKEDGRFRKF